MFFHYAHVAQFEVNTGAKSFSHFPAKTLILSAWASPLGVGRWSKKQNHREKKEYFLWEEMGQGAVNYNIIQHSFLDMWRLYEKTDFYNLFCLASKCVLRLT